MWAQNLNLDILGGILGLMNSISWIGSDLLGFEGDRGWVVGSQSGDENLWKFGEWLVGDDLGVGCKWNCFNLLVKYIEDVWTG